MENAEDMIPDRSEQQFTRTIKILKLAIALCSLWGIFTLTMNYAFNLTPNNHDEYSYTDCIVTHHTPYTYNYDCDYPSRLCFNMGIQYNYILNNTWHMAKSSMSCGHSIDCMDDIANQYQINSTYSCHYRDIIPLFVILPIQPYKSKYSNITIPLICFIMNSIFFLVICVLKKQHFIF